MAQPPGAGAPFKHFPLVPLEDIPDLVSAVSSVEQQFMGGGQYEVATSFALLALAHGSSPADNSDRLRAMLQPNVSVSVKSCFAAAFALKDGWDMHEAAAVCTDVVLRHLEEGDPTAEPAASRVLGPTFAPSGPIHACRTCRLGPA